MLPCIESSVFLTAFGYETPLTSLKIPMPIYNQCLLYGPAIAAMEALRLLECLLILLMVLLWIQNIAEAVNAFDVLPRVRYFPDLVVNQTQKSSS